MTSTVHLPAHSSHEREQIRQRAAGGPGLASQDVVIEVVRELNEQLWMIRAQFPEAGRR